MSQVFISYRQENNAHCDRVRSLAERLEANGITVILDQFAGEREFHGGAPPRGWDLWSIQMATDAPSVLIVGSSGWFQVINNPQPTATGKGAAAEAETVVHRLYRNSGYNSFASIGYFDAAQDLAHLPPYLDKCGRFDFTDNKQFDSLLKWLNRPPMPGTSPPPTPLSPATSTPSTNSFPGRAAPIDTSGFLDCRDAFSAFERLLNPDNRKRVLLLEGEGEHGKSELITRFFAYAVNILSPNSTAFIRLSPPVKEPLRLLDYMCDSLGHAVSPTGTLYERSRLLLDSRTNLPTVLFVDGFEHAENEHAL